MEDPTFYKQDTYFILAEGQFKATCHTCLPYALWRGLRQVLEFELNPHQFFELVGAPGEAFLKILGHPLPLFEDDAPEARIVADFLKAVSELFQCSITLVAIFGDKIQEIKPLAVADPSQAELCIVYNHSDPGHFALGLNSENIEGAEDQLKQLAKESMGLVFDWNEAIFFLRPELKEMVEAYEKFGK